MELTVDPRLELTEHVQLELLHMQMYPPSIANFRMWPDKEEELYGYGDDMIKKIVEHLENYFEDKDQILAEWPLLRNGVFEAFQKGVWKPFLAEGS